MAYVPFYSVWTGDDATLLEKLLTIYPRSDPEIIVDTTYNRGHFWRHSTRKIISVDINPDFNPDFVADNKHMPFGNSYADVLVYDPPHLPTANFKKRIDEQTPMGAGVKGFISNYGLDHTTDGLNVASEFAGFFGEAYRVLKPEGLVLMKICDLVHSGTSQWQHIFAYNAGLAHGFILCDMIVKVRKGAMISSKWKNLRHARKCHSFWMIFRKSTKC